MDIKEVLAIWRESVSEKTRKEWLNVDPTDEDRVVLEDAKPKSEETIPAVPAASAATAATIPAAADTTPAVAATSPATTPAVAAPAGTTTPPATPTAPRRSEE